MVGQNALYEIGSFDLIPLPWRDRAIKGVSPMSAIQILPISKIKIPKNYSRVTKGISDSFYTLSDSIKEHGFQGAIVINKDHVLLDGRHRLDTMKLLGFTEIPCEIY